MNCPKCHFDDIKRTAISENEEFEETYRRYSCKLCGHVFFTVEFEVVENEQFFDTFFDNIVYERREE